MTVGSEPERQRPAVSASGPSAPRPSLAELGPGCYSCLSCDRLSGSPRAPGLRGLDQDSCVTGGAGAAQGLPAQALLDLLLLAHPGSRSSGVYPSMEGPPLPSVLKVPPAAQSQESVSKDTENLSPISGDTGLLVLYLSVRGGGPSVHLSPGRPPRPLPSFLHREQVLLSASSVPL